MRLRIEAVNTWQSNHARKLNYLGGLFFIGVTYLFIQSFIVGTSNPELAAERYVKAAITRDDAFFDINNDFKDSKKLEVFPVKYTKGINASDWLNFSDIRGLSGTAEVTVTPADSRFDQTPVIFKMKAQYKTVLGIFREPIWVPAEPTATITIDYPNSGNALIYINGYMAGTTSNPAVKEGTYHIYPGRLEVTFYVDGEETNDGFSYFIQPSGDYKSN